MKKVLFSATVDSHILQFHLPYLQWFKEQGYEVHVATNGNEKIPYCDVKHTVSFERSPLKINNLKAIWQMKKIIENEKFDIIHCHTPMGSVVTRIAAMKARKKYGTRVIYTAHGFHFFKGAPIINWMMFYPVEKWLSKYTDTLITINQEDYELAKKKFKKCKDVELVHGVGLDTSKFEKELTDEEKRNKRKELGINNDDIVFSYVAELNKNKNQILLINTIKELKDEISNIKLLLVGSGDLFEKFRNIIKENNLENNVKLLGKRNDINEILSITDIYLASSKREGLPVNVMEAMYKGIPIIATDNRGHRELIENEKNGFIVRSQSEMKQKIESLLYYKNLIKKFNQNQKKEKEKYLLENVSKKMKNIYKVNQVNNKIKKRVLFLLASDRFSGAENVVCTIINNISNEFQCAYCCPDGPIREQLNERNIEFLPLKRLSYVEMKKILKKFKPDIIHANDYKASCLAALFAGRFEVISHIHVNNKIVRKKNIKSSLYKLISKKFKHIIWVSDSSLNDFFYKNNVLNKSIVLSNVIDKKYIEKKSNLYNCNESYDLIFIGRLSEQKNPERFIEIINIIKKSKNDIKVAMLGEGEKEIIIKNLLKQYNLQDNIKIYGYVKNPYPILKKSKILVFTSKWEGTPMAALEAQALGKPIIGTKVDGLKKIIKNDYNGFLSDNNEDIARKILSYLDDKEYKKLVNNIKTNFANINNETEYFTKIRKIYV